MKSSFFASLLLTITLSHLAFAKSKPNPVPTNVPPPVKMGQMTDSRNGKTYKTTQIGTQTWMAENLNFLNTGSACYENQKSNCEKFGRLYEWEAAKTVCPAGWHLPSDDEWAVLEKELGGIDSAGKKLKSTNGWTNNGNGTNNKGFNALPAGNLDIRGVYTNMERSTGFWTSSSKFGGGAWYRMLTFENNNVIRIPTEKTNSMSVRCLKDGN